MQMSGNASPGQATDLRRAAVLVVEDNNFTRNLIVSVLRKIGIGSIREAASAAAAFGILEIAPVNLILCDVEMHPMDGLTFLERLRTGNSSEQADGGQGDGGQGDVPPSDIPVIILTAHADADIVRRARNAGATAFLTKPIKPDLVRNRIEAVLGGARVRTDPLWRLIYHSCIPDRVTREDIKAILLSSRRNNGALGITGALYMDGDHFLQAIEGPRPAVEQLYARIRSDSRNAGVVLIAEGPADRRHFGEWTMLLVGADQLTPELCRRYCDTATFEPARLGPATALELLKDVAARKRK